MKIIDRLFQYLEIKGIKHTRFEKDIGLSNGYLGTQLRRKADLGESVIIKIIDNCLDLSPIWLITGHGNMMLSNSDATPQIPKNVPCQACIDKEKVITTLEKYNSLLEDTVISQKNTIAALESESKPETSPSKQTG